MKKQKSKTFLQHGVNKMKVSENPQLKSIMTDSDWEQFGPWLKSMLKMGPATITFTKKDGTERVMECTLQPELLPPVVVTEDTESKKKKAANDNVVAVYDLEAKGWRSFTLRTVKRVEFKM
jgi:hypothetical protein